ncbi:hypothetical protein EVA_18556 [gut metagenome]|uniref:Uncharacterized protein n=1 Tax=gut metagenome TaxID=749906 RepID=J9FUS8_9ZZZZ
MSCRFHKKEVLNHFTNRATAKPSASDDFCTCRKVSGLQDRAGNLYRHPNPDSFAKLHKNKDMTSHNKCSIPRFLVKKMILPFLILPILRKDNIFVYLSSYGAEATVPHLTTHL